MCTKSAAEIRIFVASFVDGDLASQLSLHCNIEQDGNIMCPHLGVLRSLTWHGEVVAVQVPKSLVEELVKSRGNRYDSRLDGNHLSIGNTEAVNCPRLVIKAYMT